MVNTLFSFGFHADHSMLAKQETSTMMSWTFCFFPFFARRFSGLQTERKIELSLKTDILAAAVIKVALLLRASRNDKRKDANEPLHDERVSDV